MPKKKPSEARDEARYFGFLDCYMWLRGYQQPSDEHFDEADAAYETWLFAPCGSESPEQEERRIASCRAAGRNPATGELLDSAPDLMLVRPSEGYTRENTVVVARRANALRMNATPTELRQLADWLETRLRRTTN